MPVRASPVLAPRFARSVFRNGFDGFGRDIIQRDAHQGNRPSQPMMVGGLSTVLTASMEQACPHGFMNNKQHLG